MKAETGASESIEYDFVCEEEQQPGVTMKQNLSEKNSNNSDLCYEPLGCCHPSRHFNYMHLYYSMPYIQHPVDKFL